MSSELEGKVERLELKKDDLLVVTFDKDLTLEQMRRVSETLTPIVKRKGLSKGDVVILCSGARLTVVNKAGDAA